MGHGRPLRPCVETPLSERDARFGVDWLQHGEVQHRDALI
jgi:hypothetical protein